MSSSTRSEDRLDKFVENAEKQLKDQLIKELNNMIMPMIKNMVEKRIVETVHTISLVHNGDFNFEFVEKDDYDD